MKSFNVVVMGVEHGSKTTFFIFIWHELTDRLKCLFQLLLYSRIFGQPRQMVMPLHLDAWDPSFHHQPTSKIHASH